MTVLDLYIVNRDWDKDTTLFIVNDSHSVLAQDSILALPADLRHSEVSYFRDSEICIK